MNDKFPLKGHVFKRDDESLGLWSLKQYICINCNLKIKIRKKPDGTKCVAVLCDEINEINDDVFELGYFYDMYLIHFQYFKCYEEVEKALYQPCDQRIIKQIIE